jgi:uncharacterized protein (TIGR04141 family)
MAATQNSIKTNKLVINLIKEGITNASQLYDTTNTNIGTVALDGVGTFIYTKSYTKSPDWLTKFFPNTPTIDPSNFKVASSQALLIVEIEHSGSNRFMTVAFGSGRFLLLDGMIEERFGLRTTLNLIAPDEIRRIDKKNLSSNPKLSREQIAKATGVADYDFDFESDIVQALTGSSNDSNFGKTVSGRDSLIVSVKVDKTNIKAYLASCLETYDKTTYTTNFAWIDQIKEVRDNTVIAPLLAELLVAISSGSDKVVLSIPEIIEWDSFGGFKYSMGKREELKRDLEMVEMLEAIKFDETPTIETLKKHHVTMWNADNTAIEKKWPVFTCLTAEIEMNGKTYILTESKWFEVDQDYMTSIDNAFTNVPSSALSYIPYTHRTELEYNTAFAPTIAGGCLDQKTIVHGAGKSKIEFCDVMTDQKQFIHVKKYTGSATLSHLFKQGMVASELVLKDPEFRKKVRRRLQNIPLLSAFQPMVPLSRPKPNEYSIIFAIAQKGTGPLSLPLFSKIALRSTVERLKGYDFKVYLDKIPM